MTVTANYSTMAKLTPTKDSSWKRAFKIYAILDNDYFRNAILGNAYLKNGILSDASLKNTIVNNDIAKKHCEKYHLNYFKKV